MEISRWKRRASRCPLAVEAAVMLAAASLRILFVQRQRLVHVLGVAASAEPLAQGRPINQLTMSEQTELRSARAVGRMVTRVARVLPWRPTCLRQSLATTWMLRRRGIANALHLGVAQVSTMDAHAWVTVDGWVVNGRVSRSFTPVASFHS